jgi:2-methylfumaryl-CoA hydratase
MSAGRFFEDFRVGETIRHATPRTMTEGDRALYAALTGSRFALQSSSDFAYAAGYPAQPLDDLLIFHVVFGKTVPDVSLNAVANLGYAEGRFLAPVYPEDTLSAVSEVIGVKETSSRDTGVVHVRTRGFKYDGKYDGIAVLDYVRWVLVRKRDAAAPAPATAQPALADRVVPDGYALPAMDPAKWDSVLAGSDRRWEDYAAGERIDHVDGMTVEEAEHQLATRLYQNTARVHFNAFTERQGRFGKRLVYGGHIISMARALSFNGLENCCRIAAINGGRHVAPVFAGDTLFAWSKVLERAELPHRADWGALRLRLVATKDRPCADFPLTLESGAYDPAVVLDFDHWVLIPRRARA